MKHYFIYNPAAGDGVLGKKFLEEFNELKEKTNFELFLHVTSSAGDATSYVEKIASENSEDVCIYACGGDGTMNEVINGCMDYPNLIFGIIPTGSCNDFLKIFKGHDFLSLDAQLKGTIKPIDVLKVDDHYCLNVANIGFDAKVNYDQIQARSKCKTIKGAYNYAIIKNLFHNKPDYVVVKSDDKEIYRGKALLMAFGNGGYYGGGYNCAPRAVIDDGLTDLLIVKKVPLIRFLTLIKKYKQGKLNFDPKYKNILINDRASKFEVSSPNLLTVCLDGETIHLKKITIENLKQKIRFIFPKMKQTI